MPITLSPTSASPSAWSPSAEQGRAPVLAQAIWLGTGLQRQAALRWVMRRNCSISPAQLLAVYLSLCAVSLLIATGFFMQGAKPVLVFAGIELFALGVALLVYARHVGDHETLTLAGRFLQVQQQEGPRTRRAEFRAEWLAVEPSAGQGSLVELSGEGQRLRIGRFLRPEMRAAFAQDLRLALRRACLAPVDSSETREPSETDQRIESQEP